MTPRQAGRGRAPPRHLPAELSACGLLLLLLAQPSASLSGRRTSITRTLLQATDGAVPAPSGGSDTTGAIPAPTAGTGTTAPAGTTTTPAAAAPTTGENATATAPTPAAGGTGTAATVLTASAALAGDVAAVRCCLPFNILILPGPPPSPVGAATNATETGSAGGNATADLTAGNVTTALAGAGGGNVTAGAGMTGQTGAGANATAPANATVGGGGALIVMQADVEVINATAITYSPSGGILSLALSQGYRTSHIVNLTVYTANASSLRYVQNFGPGNLVVGPGFQVDTFSAAATSLGGILVQGLNSSHVYITNTGMGTVALNGSFVDADIVAGGTSKVYLAGNTSGTVTVSADGISTTWVQGSNTAHITGSANGLAKVVYSSGTCTVQPAFMSIFGVSIFGDPCQRAAGGSGIPPLTASWSCGQEVDGQSVCPDVDVGSASGIGLEGESGTGQTASTTGAGDVNTASGAPGSVTTGTYTTPGGTASASGTVSGPEGYVTGQQSSTGGSPPVFTASAAPGMLSPTAGSGLDPDFMGGLGPGSAYAGAVSTGSPATASAINTGGPPVTAISTGNPTDLSSALNIPSTGSGLSIRGTTCDDPSSSRTMLLGRFSA